MPCSVADQAWVIEWYNASWAALKRTVNWIWRALLA